MHKYTNGNRNVYASSVSEAIEIMYPNTYYRNPNGRGSLPTVYVRREMDHYDIIVYKIGDKQGKEWGDNEAKPEYHTVYRCG